MVPKAVEELSVLSAVIEALPLSPPTAGVLRAFLPNYIAPTSFMLSSAISSKYSAPMSV
jgi:hypothetical protein